MTNEFPLFRYEVSSHNDETKKKVNFQLTNLTEKKEHPQTTLFTNCYPGWREQRSVLKYSLSRLLFT